MRRPPSRRCSSPPSRLSSLPRPSDAQDAIKHFVALMQENHSFDNYFGTFPGADGIPRGTCMPVGRARRAVRAAVPPRRIARCRTSARRPEHRIQYTRARWTASSGRRRGMRPVESSAR